MTTGRNISRTYISITTGHREVFEECLHWQPKYSAKIYKKTCYSVLTDAMKQSFLACWQLISWKTSCLFWNSEVHYYIHKTPYLYPLWSKMHLVHIFIVVVSINIICLPMNNLLWFFSFLILGPKWCLHFLSVSMYNPCATYLDFHESLTIRTKDITNNEVPHTALP